MPASPLEATSSQRQVSDGSNASLSQTPIATSSGVQLKRDADLLIQHFLPPTASVTESTQQEYQSRPLPYPLCIPQISVSAEWDSAFARGYNDELQSVGISQEMLLNFIDGLNLAIQASPPLRVVSLVGTVIGFVPYHWAMIAGAAITTAAQTGMRVISKTLTDRYLRAANLNLFHPRGLSVRLCTTPAMQLLISETDENGETKKKGKTKERLNKFGRGVGSALLKSPIPLPLASSIVRAVADKPSSVPVIEGETIQGSVLRRRLAVVQEPGLALPLRLDGMPPPVKPEGVMDKMSAWGVKADSWFDNRRERKNEQRRRALKRFEEENLNPWSLQRQMPGRGFEDDLRDPDSSRRETTSSGATSKLKEFAGLANDYLEKRSMRREIEEERIYRARKGLPIVGSIGAPKSRMERRVADEDLLERWATDKILWIVIMSADNDSQIDGIERAESAEEEEQIDQNTWRREMVQEREDIEEEVKHERFETPEDEREIRSANGS
ncbi:hypothetical protein D9758_008148 [Tetrapyrgos nigripes]|uniref:Uncharacterized protein n=1 Tax=Tetrapyrgos nigripes TaxID=182062 RepID=A0A8H5LPQ2_9AGAR|nr:hypothetical protein D9758_008148 [Tetrapyrgos nigripes]